MNTKLLLGTAIVTFLLVAGNASGAETPELNQEQTGPRSAVLATPPQRTVLPEVKGRSMPLFGGGVGIKTMKPAPEKSTVMRCREQDARIMTMESPTNIGFPCD